jgi:ribosomal protein S1
LVVNDRITELADAVGRELEGTVTRVLDFGAFVDLGGIEGLLHVDDMSWTGERDPKAFVWKGRVLQVKLASVDVAKRRVSLTLKDPSGDPWKRALDDYPVGSIRRARVVSHVSVASAQCLFVQLEAGVDALVHHSDLPEGQAASGFSPGSLVVVRIVSVDVERRRVSAAID